MARTSKKVNPKPAVEEIAVEEVTVTAEPVKEIPKETKAKVEPVVKKCVVTATKLNLRKGPGTDTEVLTILSMGDKLEITSETPRFYAVKASGFNGFVMKDFVSVL